MSNKFIIISICTIVVIFAVGWEIVMFNNKSKNFNHITQAVPVIRFERFDKQRNALIIGLFNPGTFPIEINRAELTFYSNEKLPGIIFSDQEYDEKPLVLDPDDTILIPLRIKHMFKFLEEKGNYWGELYFQIPGQKDFYSLHHRFSNIQLNDNHKIQKIKSK